MANRAFPFLTGEWYHCFNRGIDKRRVFSDKRDYERFLMLLLACNNVAPVHVSNFEQGNKSKTFADLVEIGRESGLVDIGVYSLMPTHYHMLLQERTDGGISLFMQKIGTAYTMYFNLRNGRVGSLFQGTFKAKRIDTDQYLTRVVSYIHANHAELREPKWKTGIMRDKRSLKEFLLAYRYSSLIDYSAPPRPQSQILNKEALLKVAEVRPSMGQMFEEARIYARDHEE